MRMMKTSSFMYWNCHNVVTIRGSKVIFKFFNSIFEYFNYPY